MNYNKTIHRVRRQRVIAPVEHQSIDRQVSMAEFQATEKLRVERRLFVPLLLGK